ncbi:MAG: SDR family oxidoreductase [Chitinophagia bacterium]|nr:SDR family oxidoreductase [Chitinophagia bacterium]
MESILSEEELFLDYDYGPARGRRGVRVVELVGEDEGCLEHLRSEQSPLTNVYPGNRRVMEKLNGKKVLIAGATGGIGSQAARMLAGSGAEVFLTGRKADRLAALADSIGVPHGRCFVTDLTDAAAVASMAEDIGRQCGPIDILVNASGIGIIKPVEQLSPEEFNLTLQANLTAAFLLVRAFLPGMKEVKKGLIINIPGVLGKVPMAGAAAYSASKYGLVGMMQSIREEVKRTEIRITNLFLGGVDSPFWDTIDLRVQKDRMIRSEEAARAIWFLCQQPLSGVVSEMVLQPFNHQAI